MRYVHAFLAALSIFVLAAGALAEEPKAGQLLDLELLFADVGPAAGSGEMTAAKIMELEKQGKLDSLTRVKLSVVENVPGMVQYGDTVSIVTGRVEGFPGRGQQSAFSRQNVGTMVSATARVEADGSIIIELNAERSGLVKPKPAAEGDAQAEPPKISQLTSRTTVRVASGKPVIVGGQQSATGNESVHSYMVLTASVAGGAKAAAAPRADARQVAVIKVFTLVHARASDVIKAIRPILEGQPIVLAADERTNSVIAHATDEHLEIAAALIQRLDQQ
jgi:type II secretory pathway component GspD/PulD (secretin)